MISTVLNLKFLKVRQWIDEFEWESESSFQGGRSFEHSKGKQSNKVSETIMEKLLMLCDLPNLKFKKKCTETNLFLIQKFIATRKWRTKRITQGAPKRVGIYNDQVQRANASFNSA